MFKTPIEGKEAVSYGRDIIKGIILELSITVVSIKVEDSGLLIQVHICMKGREDTLSSSRSKISFNS